MGHKKARWCDPENKDLLPTAWVAIGKVIEAIGRAGGGGGSDVVPFTTVILELDENLELELTHPSSAAKAIRGKTTAPRLLELVTRYSAVVVAIRRRSADSRDARGSQKNPRVGTISSAITRLAPNKSLHQNGQCSRQ
jgi:hypothetical protein